MHQSPADNPLDVVIVGAGVAGLEAMMALRALAGSRVSITIVAPTREFTYRPLSVGEPFDVAEARSYELDGIARDFDTTVLNDELTWAATSSDRIFLRSGAELEYDALVLAVGAHAQEAWPRGVTF